MDLTESCDVHLRKLHWPASADSAEPIIQGILAAVFTALEHASTHAKHYAGSMFWREIKS